MTTKTTRATKATTNVENVANDDTTTTTNDSRATTRAIRDIDFTKTTHLNIDDTNAKFVKMSSGNIRIDHVNCKHATSGNEGKRDRAKCRARIERYIREQNA